MKFKRIFPGWLSKFMMVICIIVASALLIEDYRGRAPELSRIFICALAFFIFYLDYNVTKYNDQDS